MDVDFQEQNVSFLREEQLDTIYQEEVTEQQLPDSLPQIEQILSCSGAVFVKNKEITDGKAVLSGQIRACVLYRAEGESAPQTVEKEWEFNVCKELPASETEQTVFCRSWIKRIDAKMLNSRKLLIRANIGCSFTVYSPSSVSVNVPAEPPKTLQLLKNAYDMLLPSYIGETEFRMNEECALPETAAGISKILRCSAGYRVSESKTVGDKAVFKGDVLLHIFYASSTGSLHCFDTELPFSHYTELNGEAETGDARVFLQPVSAEIDTDGQEDTKRILISLCAASQVVVYDKKRVELIEDAYVTRGELDAEWQELQLPAMLDSQTLNVSSELSVAAMADKVFDAQVYADRPVVRRDGEKMKAVVPVFAWVLILDRDGKLQGKEVKNEITCDTACASDSACSAACDIFEQPVCLASYDAVTLRLTAQMCIDNCMGSKLHTLRSAKVDLQKAGEHARASLIAKRAGEESVWEIAKSCGSTVEAICEANGLSSGVVQEGAILLIPMQ